MNHPIYPCLWFDGQAKAAADFYCSIFESSKITDSNPMVTIFEVDGQKIMGLNGGPMYSINASISLFVNCKSVEETERIWNQLIVGGTAMMNLDKYPWSEKYGWLKDKFGMTWQIMFSDIPEGWNKINPSLLFVGENYGKAQEALAHYTSIFEDSKIHHLEMYKEGESQPAGNLKFGHFTVRNSVFSAMDGMGDHEFEFNEGVSFVVNCDTQAEIDFYWEKLTEGGSESKCGWLKDMYGISWQIIPSMLGVLLTNPENGQRAMQAMLGMQKLDIEKLKNA